jgi:hypothetical protein
MEKLEIVLSVKELTEIVNESIRGTVQNYLTANKGLIENSIYNYFKRTHFGKLESQFESSLDWVVESSFRLGLEQAMTELNFKELVAEKCKEFLSNENFIRDLAEKKVRESLGLPLS